MTGLPHTLHFRSIGYCTAVFRDVYPAVQHTNLKILSHCERRPFYAVARSILGGWGSKKSRWEFSRHW